MLYRTGTWRTGFCLRLRRNLSLQLSVFVSAGPPRLRHTHGTMPRLSWWATSVTWRRRESYLLRKENTWLTSWVRLLLVSKCFRWRLQPTTDVVFHRSARHSESALTDSHRWFGRTALPDTTLHFQGTGRNRLAAAKGSYLETHTGHPDKLNQVSA